MFWGFYLASYQPKWNHLSAQTKHVLLKPLAAVADSGLFKAS